MGGGYIKVWRKMLDSEVMRDDWLCRLWLWCLLRAEWRDNVRIPRGQFVTSRSVASEALGVSPSRWYRGIVRLQELGCIIAVPNSERTRITVCNYSSYQDSLDDDRTAIGQLPNSNRTATEQRTIIEEDQEEKKVRQDSVETDEHFNRFWVAFPRGRRQSRGDALKAWKKAIKSTDPETIIAAAAEYAASPVGCGRFVKGPAPWLNQECWNDDRVAWQRSDDAGGRGSAPLWQGSAAFAAEDDYDQG